MEKIMGEILQEHVDRLMMLGTLSADEFTELLRYRNAETTEYLFDSGAKEVHIRPACPPLVYGCKYLNFSRSSSEMDLITRRVIERLENGNVTDEVLQEYTDPDSEKYEKMVDEICKELHFTSLRFNRLDDMLEACGVEKCKLCTYCWDGKE